MRKNQKERTRAAIVDAAIQLLHTGVKPTVARAAEAARVSRATAYRYFPTQESLLTEVMSITPRTEPVELALQDLSTQDPEARLRALLGLFNPIVIENESEFRAALRVYLDTWFETQNKERGGRPKVRAGRRMRWLNEALKPLRDELPDPLWKRLNASLALTIGIDSIAILKDVCGLQDDEALRVLEWTALVILKGAVDQAPAWRGNPRGYVHPPLARGASGQR
ncbi:MAG TPA: TetR family transcriptional regulator [Dehalococcoidia bacterium]|nr:TetR family transcriptional regulator [Dehalococcoidia bacterium]